MKANNETGFALVTVLLTISIFMLIALSFMGKSTNSAKQNNVIEEHAQTTALAEMGSIYYKEKIINNFNIIVESNVIENNVKNNLVQNSNPNNIPVVIYQVLGKELIENLEEEMQQVNTVSSYHINNIKHSEDTEVISDLDKVEYRINFDSTGKVSKNEEILKKIQAELIFDFSDWIALISMKPTEGEEGSSIVEDISDPGNLEVCKNVTDFKNIKCQINNDKTYNTNQLIFNNSTYKVIGNLTINGNMNNDVKDSTLFITGDFSTNNFNSNSNVKIRVGGDAYFNKNINGNGSNLSIYIVGNGTFSSGLQLRDGSSVYVGRAASFNGNINTFENSVIYVNSDAKFKGINMGTNATICVNGYLTAQSNININGQNANIYARGSNNNKVIVGDEAFLEGGACSVGSSNEEAEWVVPELDWEDIKFEEKYIY